MWVGDDLADGSCRAVGRVEVSTRIDEIQKLAFQECEFSLPGMDVLEFPDEQGGDVFAGNHATLAEGQDALNVCQCHPERLGSPDKP